MHSSELFLHQPKNRSGHMFRRFTNLNSPLQRLRLQLRALESTLWNQIYPVHLHCTEYWQWYIINLDRNVKDILETQFKKIRAELVYTFKFFYPEQRAWVTDSNFQIRRVGYQARSAEIFWVFLKINTGKLRNFNDGLARRRRKKSGYLAAEKAEIRKFFLKKHCFSCFPTKKTQNFRRFAPLSRNAKYIKANSCGFSNLAHT